MDLRTAIVFALFVLISIKPTRSGSLNRYCTASESTAVDGVGCTPCPVCPVGHGLPQTCGYGKGGGQKCKQCEPGYYNDMTGPAQCVPCTRCDIYNRDTTYQCRHVVNSECGTCLPDFYEGFAHALDSSQHLYPCVHCREDTSNNNELCESYHQRHTITNTENVTEKQLSDENVNRDVVQQSHDQRDDQTADLKRSQQATGVALLLVLVVVAVCICCMCCRKKQCSRTQCRRSQPNKREGGSLLPDDVTGETDPSNNNMNTPTRVQEINDLPQEEAFTIEAYTETPEEENPLQAAAGESDDHNEAEPFNRISTNDQSPSSLGYQRSRGMQGRSDDDNEDDDVFSESSTAVLDGRHDTRTGSSVSSSQVMPRCACDAEPTTNGNQSVRIFQGDSHIHVSVNVFPSVDIQTTTTGPGLTDNSMDSTTTLASADVRHPDGEALPHPCTSLPSMHPGASLPSMHLGAAVSPIHESASAPLMQERAAVQSMYVEPSKTKIASESSDSHSGDEASDDSQTMPKSRAVAHAPVPIQLPMTSCRQSVSYRQSLYPVQETTKL